MGFGNKLFFVGFDMMVEENDFAFIAQEQEPAPKAIGEVLQLEV